MSEFGRSILVVWSSRMHIVWYWSSNCSVGLHL